MKSTKKFFALFVFSALFLLFMPQRASAAAAPSITAIPISNTSIKITWDSVDGASGYELYSSTSSTGTYSKISRSPDSTTTYTNLNLITGKTYYYKVRAYTTVNSIKVPGDYSEVVSAKAAIPAAPGSIKAETASETSINILWGAVNGTNGYEIYRATSSTGVYSKVASTNSTNYEDTGLTTGTKYYYKVRAYTTVGTTDVYGTYSAVVNSIAYKLPEASALITAIPVSNTSIKITWNSVDGASGYEVYSSTSINGTYSRITTITTASTTTYTNTSLTTGTIYYYKVRAYVTVSSIKVDGYYSEVVSVKAAIPAAPGSLKAATASETSINILWNAVNGASGYEIYRSASSTGTYSMVSDTDSASYTDTGLTTGTVYYYKVRAYTTVGTTKVYGAYSAIVNSIAYKLPEASASITAIPVSNTSIKITWNSVDGASGYEVYSSTSINGTYSRITTPVSTTTYTNTSLTSGTTYYYKVRAYVTVSSIKVDGYYSEAVSVKASIPSIPLVAASAISSTGVRISWGAVNEASGYEIYRATSSSGPYELSLSDSTSTSYEDTNLTTGTTYYYKVRAYTTLGTAQVYGSYSSVVNAKPNLAIPLVSAGVASNTSILISWGAVDGADGYDVYRATSSAGPYTLSLSSATGTSYTNSSLSPGTTYYYKVRAYTIVGATQVYGDYSKAASAKPVLSPTLVSVSTASGTSAGISWGAVDGASGYDVYRSTSSTGTYAAVMSNVTYTGYTDTGLTPGTTYYYKVRAYSTISGTQKSYGDYSSVVNVKPTLGIPSINEPVASNSNIVISWSAVKGVNGYAIYRATSGSGTYTQISTTTSAAYTDTTALTGITYYYKVCAYATVGTAKAYGSYSEVVSKFTTPATPLVTAKPLSSTSIEISWAAVKGADGYEIYIATSSTGTYTLLNSTTLIRLTDLNRTSGTTYYYKVRAYTTVGASKVYGDYSSVVSVKP